MGVRIEATSDGRHRAIYGFPHKKFGIERLFDSLDEALSWANRDEGGVMLFIEDRPLS